MKGHWNNLANKNKKPSYLLGFLFGFSNPCKNRLQFLTHTLIE